jgi:GNAT superfamily N-acetyltransferase
MLTADARDPAKLDYSENHLTAALLADDRAYFAAGGETEVLPSGVLTWLPSYEDMPVGCVAHVWEDRGAASEWVQQVEAHQRQLGAHLLRVYAPTDASSLGRAFAKAGYECATEVLMAQHIPHQSCAVRVRLVPATDAARLNFYQDVNAYPDGKTYDPQRWHAMERIKQAAGYMSGYIVKLKDEVIGAVSIAPRPSYVRLKNLVIHPAWRGVGVGPSILEAVAQMAGTRPRVAMALAGSAGEGLYRKCGFEEIGRVHEWTKPL